MEFTQNTTADGIAIALHGSFTFKDHTSFRTALDALAAHQGRRKTLDLSGVDFLDSAALGMLLIADEEISCGPVKLTLCNLSPPVSRLFELTAMNMIFIIERSA
jgi:anti-anti-sigma factor